jgi:hypothetical protein
MFLSRLSKPLRVLPFFTLLLLTGLQESAKAEGSGGFSPDKVNLALRRTADGLLRGSGDSTSRIPAVEQSGKEVWRIRLEQPFRYEQLPALLQASFDLYDIQRPYDVKVRRCSDATIDLGYHKFDFLYTRNVPCSGREISEDCHYIEISFLDTVAKKNQWATSSGIFLLLLGGLLGFWYYRKRRPASSNSEPQASEAWLEFGNSRLDVAGQLLICGKQKQSLTFREAKLLGLFASHSDRLLERDQILQQVWADEGVLVGRSMDVFVSRLRKKLAIDPTISITAIHGIGYRLETGK